MSTVTFSEKKTSLNTVKCSTYHLEINLNDLNFAVKQDYKSELDLLAESHRLGLKALESEHENYLKGTVHK